MNLVIIVSISYIFFKLRKIENREEIDKQKLENLKNKFNFLSYLDNMNDDELKYIDDIFETGVIQDRDKYKDTSKSNNNKKEIEKKEQRKKDIDKKNKLIEENKKTKLKEDKSNDDDTGTFNINFDN